MDSSRIGAVGSKQYRQTPWKLLSYPVWAPVQRVDKSVRLAMEDMLIIFLAAHMNTQKATAGGRQIFWKLGAREATPWKKVKEKKRMAKNNTKKIVGKSITIPATQWEKLRAHAQRMEESALDINTRQEAQAIRSLTRRRTDIPRVITGRVKEMSRDEAVMLVRKSKMLLPPDEHIRVQNNVLRIRGQTPTVQIITMPWVDTGRSKTDPNGIVRGLLEWFFRSRNEEKIVEVRPRRLKTVAQALRNRTKFSGCRCEELRKRFP